MTYEEVLNETKQILEKAEQAPTAELHVLLYELRQNVKKQLDCISAIKSKITYSKMTDELCIKVPTGWYTVNAFVKAINKYRGNCIKLTAIHIKPWLIANCNITRANTTHKEYYHETRVN